MNKTLFKQSKNGSIESWNIQVVENVITVTWGKVDGKQQVKVETVLEGKNIGKSNETNPSQQALFQAESTYNHKIDKGYALTIEEAKVKAEEIKPVLVHDYTLKNNSNHITFPCYAQPKLDGVRSQLFFKIEENGNLIAKSRGNKEFPINKALFEDIKKFMELNNVNVLDGEFYVHGEFLEDIISCVKKPEGNRLENEMSYVVFDLPKNRGLEKLQSLKTTERVKVIETTKVNSKEEAKKLLDYYIELGFEGLILRNSNTFDAEYLKGGVRTYDIQKWKMFTDSEYEIVNVISDKNNNGLYVCKTENGSEFNVTPKCSHEMKKEILNNKQNYIGKLLTVKYQELTALNIPKFGVGLAVRDYE